MSARLLTTGELARRAGVATSVLRYLGRVSLWHGSPGMGRAVGVEEHPAVLGAKLAD